jgi:hypothetical protein
MPPKKRNTRNGFQDAALAWEHLKKAQKDLVSKKFLTKRESKRYADAKAKKNIQDRKYYNFLNDVHEAWHDLCIIAFTRYQIDCTKQGVLAGLAQRTNERHGDIDSRIPSTLASLKKGLVGTSESSYEFAAALLEGTISVFGEALASKIKEVQIDKDWKAVTMVFPTTPEGVLGFSCFLELEVREEYLKELAMALFKIEVSWGANTFQVIHENGIVQNMPEFTHKGALDEDITAVLDPAIGSAIAECGVRQRELVEGKSRTGCVSMRFAKGGGTLILVLGIESGVQIQNKLYCT